MSSLPPGPSAGLLTTFRTIRDPLGSLSRWSRVYGDPFTVVLPLQGAVVVTADPEAVRAVFAADPETFGAAQGRVAAPILGSGALVALEGNAHKRARRLLNPPFHGERMRAYGRVIREITMARVAPLKTGARFVVQDVAGAISLEVILRAVFGLQGDAKVHRFERAVRDVMGSLGPFVSFGFMRRRFGGLGPWAAFLRARERLSALVAEEIAARAASGQAGPCDDILSLLLAARYEDGTPMATEDVFAHLLTLVAAGHETTMITLTWALDWLHRTPEVLGRLRAELDAAGASATPDAIARLPYLDAVIAETLRLYPVVPLLTRLLLRPYEMKGHRLAPGVVVGLATSLVHAREETYPEPHRFRPDRFLERSYGPSLYFPFGGGARRCLGAAFATYESKIVLASVLGAMHLRARDPRPVPPAMRAAGLGPGRRVEMVVVERRDEQLPRS